MKEGTRQPSDLGKAALWHEVSSLGVRDFEHPAAPWERLGQAGSWRTCLYRSYCLQWPQNFILGKEIQAQHMHQGTPRREPWWCLGPYLTRRHRLLSTTCGRCPALSHSALAWWHPTLQIDCVG